MEFPIVIRKKYTFEYFDVYTIIRVNFTIENKGFYNGYYIYTLVWPLF